MPFNRGGVSVHFAGSRLRFENKGGHGAGKSGGKKTPLRFQGSGFGYQEGESPKPENLWNFVSDPAWLEQLTAENRILNRRISKGGIASLNRFTK